MPESLHEFPAVYEEHYPKTVAYLRRLVGDADAEDVAQEAFVKISRSLDGFRGESRLSTWIYRIATNTAMDHLRKPSTRDATRQRVDATEDSAPDEDIIADNAPLHDSLLIRKDMSDCIRGIVDGLPEMYRTALVLSDLEGLSNAEMADVLDVSLDAVKIRLHRGRALLRKEMNKKCVLYRDSRNELACDRKPAMLNFPSK